MELHTLFRDPNLVAVRLHASDVFSVLARRVDLPVECCALLVQDDGATRVSTGPSVESRGVREIVLIRTTPIPILYQQDDLVSSDNFDCLASLHLRMQAVPERHELETFCRAILASGRRADAKRVTDHFREIVSRTLHAFARANAAESLIESRQDDAFAEQLAAALKPALFTSGLTLLSTMRLEAVSPAFDTARRAKQKAESDRQRLEEQARLREAAQSVRRQHVEELSALLARLDTLAGERPGVNISELIRTFNVGERSELYRQLLSRAVSAKRTSAIAVVAGNELLTFDPETGSILQRRALEGSLGALRSVRAVQHDAERSWLLGAATGVYHLTPWSVREYHFAPTVRLRGGVNACVMLDGSLYATHSEVGVLRWQDGSSAAAQTILTEHTTGAAAVRDIQSDEHGTLWFTAGDRVIGWSPRDAGTAQSTRVPSGPDASLDAALADLASSGAIPLADDMADAQHLPEAPLASYTGTLISIGSVTHSGGAPRVSALCVANGQVFAGTTDGRLLTWACYPSSELAAAPPRDQARTLLSGEAGSVESIQWMSGAGVDRLLVSCRRPFVWLLVLGDGYRGEYRADEPIRWAAAADDWIVAVNDRRDRLYLWRPERPDAVERTIMVSRLVGHSIQDAALVT